MRVTKGWYPYVGKVKPDQQVKVLREVVELSQHVRTHSLGMLEPLLMVVIPKSELREEGRLHQHKFEDRGSEGRQSESAPPVGRVDSEEPV